MRALLILTIVAGAIPFILYRPYVGVLVWSWIGYMNPHRLAWWSFVYDMPLAKIIGGVTLFAYFLSREPKYVPVNRVTLVWLVLILWMNLTTYFALMPDQAWPHWEKVMKIQLMALVTLAMMHSAFRINLLVWVIALSIGFYGIKGGVFTLTTGGEHMVLGPRGSFFEGNTAMALALIMVLPLFYYLYRTVSRWWLKWGLLVGIALILVSIVGSYSRGAFLGGAAMVAVLWWKSGNRLRWGAGLAVLLAGILAFMPAQWMERMETIQNYQEDASAMGRINAWWFAFNLANDRPLVGGGFQTFAPQLFPPYAPDPDDFHGAHSIYFEMLGEHGYPGLVLFLLLGWLAWRMGTQVIRMSQGRADLDWARHLAASLQVSLMGYAVGGAFLGMAYFDLFYHLVAIMVVTYMLVEREAGLSESRAEHSRPALAAT